MNPYPSVDNIRPGLHAVYEAMLKSRERSLNSINLINMTINHEKSTLELAIGYVRELYAAFDYLKCESRVASMEEYKAMRYEIAKMKYDLTEKQISLNKLHKLLKETMTALEKIENELNLFVKSERRGMVISYDDIAKRKR
jgi:septal ring factor EnvC (AmiA/AmiB activator)